LAKTPRSIAETVSQFLSGTGKVTRFNPTAPAKRRAQAILAEAEAKSRDPKAETFFDTEFLRKLERLHLVAKRLNWRVRLDTPMCLAMLWLLADAFSRTFLVILKCKQYMPKS
jgi:hypothetical protein